MNVDDVLFRNMSKYSFGYNGACGEVESHDEVFVWMLRVDGTCVIDCNAVEESSWQLMAFLRGSHKCHHMMPTTVEVQLNCQIHSISNPTLSDG